MEPRKEESKKAAKIRKHERKPKLQIVRLEERIAPALTSNHNETLVREPAKVKPKAAPAKTGGRPGRK